MKILFWVLGCAAGALLLFALIGGYCMFRVAIRRHDKRANPYWNKPLEKPDSVTDAEFERMKEGEALLKGRMCEFIPMKSRDGLNLIARYYRHPSERGIFLMVHGYGSSSIGDFSGAVKSVWDMGYSLFMIDERAHGMSGGRVIGLGVRERFDVVDWAKLLKEQHPDVPVVADGVSMGAATVMFACGVGWPDNVKAVIADCGFTSAGEICKVCMRKWFHLPVFPVYYGAKLWTRILGGYDLDAVTARESLAKLADPSLYEKPLPVLLAHGRKDDFVPYRMSEENMKAFLSEDGTAAPNAEFFTSDTAEHGMSFLRDYDGYMQAIFRLLDKAGLRHDRVEEEIFVPETPVEELTRPEMPMGEVFSVN